MLIFNIVNTADTVFSHVIVTSYVEFQATEMHWKQVYLLHYFSISKRLQKN